MTRNRRAKLDARQYAREQNVRLPEARLRTRMSKINSGRVSIAPAQSGGWDPMGRDELRTLLAEAGWIEGDDPKLGRPRRPSDPRSDSNPVLSFYHPETEWMLDLSYSHALHDRTLQWLTLCKRDGSGDIVENGGRPLFWAASLENGHHHPIGLHRLRGGDSLVELVLRICEVGPDGVDRLSLESSQKGVGQPSLFRIVQSVSVKAPGENRPRVFLGLRTTEGDRKILDDVAAHCRGQWDGQYDSVEEFLSSLNPVREIHRVPLVP